jgi:NAD(P)-dependent dehydrogenase (short-subunit alcohol dehydrogenase family)
MGRWHLSEGQLVDPCVIVTGAASGIGRAVTLRFAAAGATVVCTDRDADALAETVELAGGAPTAMVGDLTDTNLPQRLVTLADGRVDVLVNVAGLFDNFAPLEDTSDELWQLLLDVNLTAPMRLCRAVMPSMIDAGSGSIVNIASIAGLGGANAGAAYTASKHGVVGLTRNIAALYGDRGVRCNAICPAGVTTNLIAHSEGQASRWVMERMQSVSLVRGSRSAEPDEIAALVAFLCSPDAVNINGAAIATDGGWTAM